MFKFRYILVDDSVAGVGGTAFTLEGILEPVKDLVLSIPTRELSLTDVVKHSDKIWIFGNIHGISVESFNVIISAMEILQKNGKYAIIDGQGGWHSKAKGVKESISYATNNNISYDILKTESHEELMRQLCHYTGLIFLPIIHDTCPRITIESKLLGLDLIINEKCQHITEEWWSETLEGMEEYLSGRPAYMWDSINNALSNNTS